VGGRNGGIHLIHSKIKNPAIKDLRGFNSNGTGKAAVRIQSNCN
jgi:hypothetical protein